MLKARDLARPEFKANPYPFYARLRKDEPVCRISAAFIDAWLVTRYDDAVTVLRDPRISKNLSAKMGYIPRFAQSSPTTCWGAILPITHDCGRW